MTLPSKKKLLVLDLNGLLIERFGRGEKLPKHRRPDGKVGRCYVYRRPYCNEFLAFCFKNFEVGIWSSAQKHNVQKLVDFVFGDLKSKLLFCWYQCDCTNTGLKTLENKRKPVFLKELYKLWDKLKPDLPWARGDYGPFNTLLIDDTPYKAMRNPPHTAIFPYPYEVSNEPDDGLVGPFLKYLEGISAARNVQHYVECHRFGQPPISEESPHWYFYRKILSIRLPTVNRNSGSVVRTETSGVANKTMTSIAYNNGTTQSPSISHIEREETGVAKAIRSKKEKNKSVMEAALSQKHGARNISEVEKEAGLAISQQSDLDVVSKDDGLSEIAYTRMTERNDSSVTTLSQKHATLNGLEESGVAKARKRRRKRIKNVEQHALNQKHGAHNISEVEKEAGLAISQQSDLDMVSKDDGLSEIAYTRMTERNDSSVAILSQKHATLNGLEESGVAKARKRRRSVEQNALNQEHGAHNKSDVEKEAGLAISQQSDLDKVSKDDGLSEIAYTRMTERNDSSVTALSQKHATLNGIEKSGVAKARKRRRKKRKSVEQHALNQEHGAHNMFKMEKEAAFNLVCLSPVSGKEDGLPGAIVSTLSQKNASLNGLEESGAAKAAKPGKKRKGAEQTWST